MNKYSLVIRFSMLALMGMISIPAFAATSSYEETCSTSLRRTDWKEECKIAKFDTSKGTLTKVTMRALGYIEGIIKIENKDATSKTITARYTANVSMKQPNGDDLLNTNAELSFSKTLPKYDDINDFAGESGTVSDKLTNEKTQSVVITSPSGLQLFIDTNIVTFQGGATGSTSLSGGANVSADWDTFAREDLVVTYEYTSTPTPTPIPTPTPTPTPIPTPTLTIVPVVGQVKGDVLKVSKAPLICKANAPGVVPELASVRMHGSVADLQVKVPGDAMYCQQLEVQYSECGTGGELKKKYSDVVNNGEANVTVDGLSPDSLYRFQVRCVNQCAVGDYSSSLQGLTSGSGQMCPYTFTGDIRNPQMDSSDSACPVSASISPQPAMNCPASVDTGTQNGGSWRWWPFWVGVFIASIVLFILYRIRVLIESR